MLFRKGGIDMFKKMNIIIGSLISIFFIIGLLFTLDNRWAKAEKLELVAMRLEQKIEKDRAFILQERIWKIDDRYKWKGLEMPDLVLDEYRRLNKEMQEILKELERKINRINNKKKKDD